MISPHGYVKKNCCFITCGRSSLDAWDRGACQGSPSDPFNMDSDNASNEWLGSLNSYKMSH